MKALWYFIIYFSLLCGLAVGPAHGKADLQPVTLQLKWYHQFQFAGYYAALQQGFYEDEGLQVTIQEGGPSVAVDLEVLSGRADFGVLGSELIEGRILGKPLVLLAVIMQHSTRAIIVRTESDINGPADFIGRRVILNRNEDAEFRAMFAAEGISFDRLSVTAKDQGANRAFIEGRVDALNGSIANQPFTFTQAGLNVKTIRPISYGIDFYGDSLFTSEAYIKDNPEQAEAFRRASLKGWYYAMNNVEKVVDLILSDYSQSKTREHLFFEAKTLRELILPELVDIGHISLHRIERIAYFYSQLGLVPPDYSVEGFIYEPTGDNPFIRRLAIILFVVLMVAVPAGVILLIFNSRLKKRVAEQTRALSDSNTLLTSVVEGTTDAIFLKDLKGRYLLANSATLKALGKTEQEVIGKDDSELFSGDSIKVINDADSRVMQSGVPCIAEEHLETTYGLSYWLTNKSPYWDADGNIIGLIGISREISELKQIETEKNELQHRLAHAQKMESVGTLAGGIAHDFNNILAAIIGYAELVQDDSQEGSRVRHDIDQVIIASHRAKELVKQILTFSRQAEPGLVELEAAAVVKEIGEMVCTYLPATIDIQQEIDAEVGVIFAELTQIHQLLANLITNAFHAMEEGGGTLTISLHSKEISSRDLINDPDVQPGRFAEITVTDTGVGIASHIVEKIFDPYFTTKEVGKGTGMGLSIVHGIVKNYGGFVVMESELGKGTSFRVYLPVIEQQLSEQKMIEDQVPLGSERILLVDDEQLLVKVGKTMLESLGYQVTARHSSYSALEAFKEHPDRFDVVITDQTMPHMTGSVLSEKILHIRPNMPIILCTGYSSIMSEQRAKAIGIQEFAFKPLAKKDIARLIRKVLTQSSPK